MEGRQGPYGEQKAVWSTDGRNSKDLGYSVLFRPSEPFWGPDADKNGEKKGRPRKCS